MRWVIARVLPVPAPASTQTGPRRAMRDRPLLGVEPFEDLVGGGDGHDRPILAGVADAVTGRVPRRLGTAERRGTTGVPRTVCRSDHPRRGCTSCQPRQRTPKAPHRTTLTMYSTTWCGYCRRLKDQMDREGIDFVEVDIELDEAAADLVMQVNGGNQTVPTLVFPDGSALTNPSVAQVRERLSA